MAGLPSPLSAASVAAPSVSLLRGMDAAQLPGVMVFTDEVPFERSISMAAEVHAVRPDIALSGDFIVGFPGETAADFPRIVGSALRNLEIAIDGRTLFEL